MRIHLLMALFAVGIVLPVRAALIADDPFTDGDHTGGDDPLGLVWNLSSYGDSTTIGVGDDSAGLGTGNALFITNAVASLGKVVYATFPQVSLQASGVATSVTLSLDFRFTDLSTALASNYGLRFGLFDTKGNGFGSDDAGYLGLYGVAGGSGVELYGENTAGAAHLGGSGTYELTDTHMLAGGINDLIKHTLRLTLNRTSQTAMSIDMWIDGVLRASSTSSTSITTNFDAVVLVVYAGQAHYAIDNVRIEDSTPSNPIAGGIIPTVVMLTATGTVGNVQWQKSADGQVWTDVAGATSPDLNVAQLFAETPWFQVKVTSGADPAVYSPWMKVTSQARAGGTIITVR